MKVKIGRYAFKRAGTVKYYGRQPYSVTHRA